VCTDKQIARQKCNHRGNQDIYKLVGNGYEKTTEIMEFKHEFDKKELQQVIPLL
jgi:hypothetical protein